MCPFEFYCVSRFLLCRRKLGLEHVHVSDEENPNWLCTGDYVVTKHSNLPLAQLVFHLVTGKRNACMRLWLRLERFYFFLIVSTWGPSEGFVHWLDEHSKVGRAVRCEDYHTASKSHWTEIYCMTFCDQALVVTSSIFSTKRKFWSTARMCFAQSRHSLSIRRRPCKTACRRFSSYCQKTRIWRTKFETWSSIWSNEEPIASQLPVVLNIFSYSLE